MGGGNLGSCLSMGVVKFQYFLVRDLLKINADPNKTDIDGNTAFHYLFTIFGRDIVESERLANILLEYGADPN